jgi:uncharacterized protein (DUF302 family)
MKILNDMHHQVVKVTSSFDEFTQNLEATLGRMDPTIIQKVVTEPRLVESHLKQMGGEENLFLIDIRNHGELLSMVGVPRKAKLYEVGNPLIAIQMTKHDIRSALYMPLRLLVYKTPDRSVCVEYDLPSFVFGQFGNAEVTKIAESLDLKLSHLIAKVDKLTQSQNRTNGNDLLHKS